MSTLCLFLFLPEHSLCCSSFWFSPNSSLPPSLPPSFPPSQVHAIFGSFLIGMIMPRDGKFTLHMCEKIDDLVSNIFLPLYFALSGRFPSLPPSLPHLCVCVVSF